MVYKGVALYREYSGRGGEASQLEEEPTPCHLCMVKIVNMAQAIHVLTATVTSGQRQHLPSPGPQSIGHHGILTHLF